MGKHPADSIIEDFFKNLKVHQQYYSVQQKQPILLIGEKDLYLAIKTCLGKLNLENPEEKPSFKPLPCFPPQKLF